MNTNKYSFNLRYSGEDEGYIAESPEFPGLSAFGETPDEAISEAKDALELFVETYLEEGKNLPEPNLSKEFSGQIRIRLPKSLHARLSKKAEDEGISLNTLMIQYLSEGLSYQDTKSNFEHLISSIPSSYSNLHKWDLGKTKFDRLASHIVMINSNPTMSYFGKENSNQGIYAQCNFYIEPTSKKETEDKLETV